MCFRCIFPAWKLVRSQPKQQITLPLRTSTFECQKEIPTKDDCSFQTHEQSWPRGFAHITAHACHFMSVLFNCRNKRKGTLVVDSRPWSFPLESLKGNCISPIRKEPRYSLRMSSNLLVSQVRSKEKLHGEVLIDHRGTKRRSLAVRHT